jgi:hypothetical protein
LERRDIPHEVFAPECEGENGFSGNIHRFHYGKKLGIPRVASYQI